MNPSGNPPRRSPSEAPPGDGGRLAVLIPGLGAVATTTIAGVEAVKRGLAQPVGAYTQLARRTPAPGEPPLPLAEWLSLAHLDDLVFGGWDIFPENCYEAARTSRVLERDLLEQVREPLSAIRPMPAVFDPRFVPRLEAQQRKQGANRLELGEALREDIRNFMREHGCRRAVMVWCGSTEVYNPIADVHLDLERFEAGLRDDDPAVSPTQIYAWAALREGLPFVNGSPNVSVEIPALRELALETGLPIAGSDLKTGQSLIKTILAPGLRKRLLGVSGWFSSNILGNRDGEVLDNPASFRAKEVTKTGVLNNIFSAAEHPELYSDLEHVVRIHYYPPRGDNKEGWDNIDIFGWLGYPMQIKINFLCRDSILAAPLVLDLALLMDRAARAGERGIQDWLGFYFKSPLAAPGTYVEHDLHVQFEIFEQALARLAATAPAAVGS